MTLNVSNCPTTGADTDRQQWPLRTRGMKMSPNGRAARTERFNIFLLGTSQLYFQLWWVNPGQQVSTHLATHSFLYQHDGAERIGRKKQENL